jgi:hypothetical protein
MNKQSKVDFALRTSDLFETEKVIIRKTGDALICYLDTDNYYFDTLVHGIYKKSTITLKALLAILNSNPATLFYRLLHDIKGKVFAKISIDNLDKFPIPATIESKYTDFESLADIMLSKNKELQETTKHFLQLLQSKFAGLSINNKLEKYYNLSFADFINELGKQKMKLSLQQESDWLTFFEQEKQKANAIKTVIDTTDKQIDEMVYKLYGLTEEEIKIVEG